MNRNVLWIWCAVAALALAPAMVLAQGVQVDPALPD